MFPVRDPGDGAPGFGMFRVGVVDAGFGMNILLDECVPWPLRRRLAGHTCATPQQRGWRGIQNGDLIRLAEGEFDLFITADQNIRYQQNLASRRIPILELSTNDVHRLEAATALIQTAVAAMRPGDFRILEIP